MTRVYSTQILNEFFGLPQIYSRMIESSPIYGKCPITLDPKKARLVLDLRFRAYSTFWCKIVFIYVTVLAPMNTILVGYVINWLKYAEVSVAENFPFFLICSYIFALILEYGMIFMYLPIVFGWKSYLAPELENSLYMFKKLLEGKLHKI